MGAAWDSERARPASGASLVSEFPRADPSLSFRKAPAMSITVLSPVGINRVEARAISERPASLEGLDIGILINNKPNSEFLQDQIAALLHERYAIGKVHKKIKPNASVGARGLDAFAKEVQAVITAIGD